MSNVSTVYFSDLESTWDFFFVHLYSFLARWPNFFMIKYVDRFLFTSMHGTTSFMFTAIRPIIQDRYETLCRKFWLQFRVYCVNYWIFRKIFYKFLDGDNHFAVHTGFLTKILHSFRLLVSSLWKGLMFKMWNVVDCRNEYHRYMLLGLGDLRK